MRKLLSGLGVIFVLTLLMTTAACSSSESSSGNGRVTLTLYSDMNPDEKKAFQEVISDFEKKHSNIKINANFPGHDLESLLRVKMGANKMPDLFDTHGWAKKRYGDYVADLSKMDWVHNLDPALKPILTDEKGKVYAYPINEAKDGITYNANVLKKYNITPPTTFEEFMKALETVKEKSHGKVTPLWIAGGDGTQIGQYFDQMATPLLITNKNHNYSNELLKGSFDWSKYTFLYQKLKEMKDKGLLNKDVLTAKDTQASNLMAQGKIAFTFINGSIGPDSTELNNDVKVGIIPNPGIYDGQKPVFSGGERYTVAAWKDSKHLKEAKEFIEFISKPKYAKKLAEATSLPAGLTNVDADNYYAQYYKKYSDVKVQPYFDRMYLPSGMWDVMKKTGQEVLSGDKTPKQASDDMSEEYKRLRKENK